MGRAPCCDKTSVKKGPWSPEEDAKLKSYIHQNGTGGNWIALPQKIGLKRCGKSCRLRWLNYLRPNIKHGGFSEEEDNIICSLYISIGSRIEKFSGSDQIKPLDGVLDRVGLITHIWENYWNTRLKKKLLGKHRKEKRGRGRERSAKPTPSGQPMAAQPSLLPPIPYSNEEPRFNDYASIRNLLIRLGGRFDVQMDGYDQIKPAVDEALMQPLYNPMDQLPQLDTTSSGVISETPSFDISAMSDFERVMHDNSQRLQGLEFYYDEFSGGVEMNSSIFAASASNNLGFLQGGMMEEFGVDKMRYQ
ncbi:hypothetical protein ACS0TY_025946 [Phlomoides rotata]